MRSKVLIAALLSFALIGASYAAVENIKVSGDITSQALTRDLSLDNKASGTLDGEDFLISQVRLRFDADLTENVSAVIRLINERVWCQETNVNTDIDLDLAYVEMKEFLYEPLTMVVGRQNIRYGNALIIGDPDTNQTAQINGSTFGDLSLRKAFEAIKAVLDYAPYTIDIVYAKGYEGSTNIDDDVTILGTNVAYQWEDYNGVTEAYFWSVRNTNAAAGSQVIEDQDKTYVIGARTQWDPDDHWTHGAEGAIQFGDANRNKTGLAGATNDQHLEAYAAQVGTEYKFLNDYNSKLGISYTFLSGDDDQADGDYNGWDPVAEDQSPGEIMNILGANTNSHFIKVTGSMMPADREDLTLGFVYSHARLVEKYNLAGVVASTYSPTVGPASGNTYAVERNNGHFGDEIDLYAIYDYTEDVQFKALGAWFLPGGFFTEENDSLSYSVRGSMSVLF